MRSAPPRLRGFFRELRQRRVFHVAAAYAAGAFVLLQAADLLTGGLHLPAWVLTLLIVLVLLGLPVALALAWVFDYGPGGLHRTPAEEPAPLAAGVPLARLGFVAVLLLAVGAAGYATFARLSTPSDRSIAVLPFTSMSEGQDYFADGMTEDLLTNLAKIGELRVISRTSVMPYKQTSKSIREISRELDVAYVVEGSVRKEGQQLRITAQLIDARTDEHVWTENYDRELTGVFAVQGEIAAEIARALRAQLSRAERQRIESVPTRSQEAYDHYLRGRSYMERYRKEENEIAIDFARRAIAADPSFAPGHALLAIGFMNRVNKFGFESSWSDSALAAAQRAVALDTALAQGYGAVAAAHLIAGRFDEARAMFEKAASLDPSNGAFTANLGVLSGLAGRHVDAVKWFRRAIAIDPSRAMATQYNLANAYIEIGLLVEAETQLDRVLALQPDVTVARALAVTLALRRGKTQDALQKADDLVLRNATDARAWAYAGEAYLVAGNHAQARRHLEKALALSPNADGYLGSSAVLLAHLLMRDDERARAEVLLAEFERPARLEAEKGSKDAELHFNLAAVAALRGDYAQALRWLAFLETSGYEPWKLENHPAFSPLRDEPGFRRLLAQINARTEDMRRQVLSDRS